ncbi:Uncharacterized protein SCF082_LOCUS10366 [Durusdinium trenchii]|uniref:Uncharacterized protein n=1 Tax=Durusdinium trenchii TaxID=1381693 RepID=A0ABP0J5Q6_9DINO
MPRIASNHIFQEVFQKENGTSILTNLMELGTNLTESIDKASATLELQESAGDQKFVFFIIFFVLVPILTLCCVELVKVASDNYHSLMEGMQSKADSEGDIKKKVILKLFQTKFGSSARDALDSCLDQWHEVMPGLLKQAHIKPDEVPAKLIAARKNPRAFAMWVRHFLSMFMLAHGTNIAQNGLEGIGLAQCGKVACGGDLQYELDSSGLHKCNWQCPAGQHPDKVKSTQDPGMSVKSAEDAWKDVETPLAEYERSSVWSTIRKISYKWTSVDDASALKIMQMKTPTVMAPVLNFEGMRFEGKCSP